MKTLKQNLLSKYSKKSVKMFYNLKRKLENQNVRLTEERFDFYKCKIKEI